MAVDFVTVNYCGLSTVDSRLRRILNAMPSRRLLSAIAFFALMAGACGTPPDKELQQAQSAIDAARTAGAD